MRVCMVAYTFYERDNRVMRYSEELVARGHTVDVLALRRRGQPGFEHYRGVNLRRIQTRFDNELKGPLSYLGRLLLFLVRTAIVLTWRHLWHRFEVIHVHSVPDFEVFAAAVPRLLGAKIILDIHDIVPEFYCSKYGVGADSVVFRALVGIERLSCSFAHHVIVANHLWRERLVERSVDASKCSVVLNYPDPRIFYERTRTRTDGSFVLLYPGTVNWHQGLDIAVRAFVLLSCELPDVMLDIYGEGPERANLLRLIDSLGLAARVRLHRMLPMADIANVMANADLAVVPKRSDSFGDEAFSTKSLEFMAMGVPLVMSSTTVDRYYFDESVVRFFRSGDEEDLAAQIRDLYHHPEVRRRLVGRARDFVAAYSWSSNSAAYLELVRRLVRRGAVHDRRTVRSPALCANHRAHSRYFSSYWLKALLPRSWQILLRRWLAKRIRQLYRHTWPISRTAAAKPAQFASWPEGKRFALVMRHDVESEVGLAQCLRVSSMDAKAGLRAAYYVVPERYPVNRGVLDQLVSEGCEIGVHGLKHDGKLYMSRRIFRERAVRINRYIEEWACSGFASPSAHHRLDWLHDLNVAYDTSTFDTDPFEPQPDGANTVFPFVVTADERGYVELPYTLPQDFTLYVVLGEESIRIWRRKLDWIAENGGMVLVNVHPDYLDFGDGAVGRYTYPASLYQEFLDYVTGRYAGQYWHALPREVASFWRSLFAKTS